MKNILITFFKVSGLTLILGIVSLLLLMLLFNDILRGGWIAILAIFLGGLTVFLNFLVIYLPIYYLNKSSFEIEPVKALFNKFLPVVLSPLTIMAFILISSDPLDFLEPEAILIFIFGYIITCFSFYQFIRFIKN